MSMLDAIKPLLESGLINEDVSNEIQKGLSISRSFNVYPSKCFLHCTLLSRGSEVPQNPKTPLGRLVKEF